MIPTKQIAIGDIVQPRKEKVVPATRADHLYVGLEHVESATTRLLTTGAAVDMKSAANVFKKGDVLYSRLRPYLNKVWVADRDGLCSSEFIVLPANKSILGKFLCYRLNAQDFVRFANALNTGDRPRVNFQQISAFTTILPPLSEQERIVAKIEELFSNLDASVAELRTAQARLKVYRQAVLKKAFEATTDNMKPLSTIASLRLGKMLDQQKNQGVDRLYLRNVNVRWFSFDLADLKSMKIQNDETEKYSVQKGDLVICEGGEPGRCAVWSKDEVMFLQKALHRVRFTNSEANPFFYAYFVMYLAMSGALKKHFTGSGISHLTGHSLANMHVPAPSVNHNRIVEEIERQLSVCDHIEQTVLASLKQSQSLRQSILKKAFEGRLV
ncbi:MAG: restriction endonuclease subunit S [Thermoguttaceae bacterium]